MPSPKDHGKISLSGFVFGIYPYVYSQPIVKVSWKSLAGNIVETIYVVLSKDIADGILNKDKDSLDKLMSLCQNEINVLGDKGRCAPVKVWYNKWETEDSIRQALKRYVWKVECKDIFNRLNAPTFVKYEDILFTGGVYGETIWNYGREISHEKHIHYITNVSFQKLNYNILKYWYDELNKINTYINIENFLWSVKQEPESIPDNKTKIISHGFDIKTSFRKM